MIRRLQTLMKNRLLSNAKEIAAQQGQLEHGRKTPVNLPIVDDVIVKL